MSISILKSIKFSSINSLLVISIGPRVTNMTLYILSFLKKKKVKTFHILISLIATLRQTFIYK
jgi:hypothetical protein